MTDKRLLIILDAIQVLDELTTCSQLPIDLTARAWASKHVLMDFIQWLQGNHSNLWQEYLSWCETNRSKPAKAPREARNADPQP